MYQRPDHWPSDLDFIIHSTPMRVAIYLNGSSHTPTTTTPMTEFTQPCHRNHVSVITFTYLLGVLFANKKNLRLVKKQIRSKAINWLYNNWSNSNIFYLCDRAVVARTTEKKVWFSAQYYLNYGNTGCGVFKWGILN